MFGSPAQTPPGPARTDYDHGRQEAPVTKDHDDLQR